MSKIKMLFGGGAPKMPSIQRPAEPPPVNPAQLAAEAAAKRRAAGTETDLTASEALGDPTIEKKKLSGTAGKLVGLG